MVTERVGNRDRTEGVPDVTCRRGQRGSAAIEMALWAPFLGVFIAAIIFGGRVALSHQSVEVAAADAARAASMARTAVEAQSAAKSMAAATLASEQLPCETTDVTLDLAAFTKPAGTPGSVAASITCVVRISDLGLPLPGTVTVEQTMSSPLDVYRARK